ncbi:hypothetical protein N0V90_007146 [Kalmusia sp. IMI 367209]|nr:hypothetical protein N0V90_007146 [Kalmusia sp. IMI 367209]
MRLMHNLRKQDILPRKSEATIADGPPIFQLLQDQNVQKASYIELEHVTTWVDETGVTSHRDRQARLMKIFSDFDGMMTGEGASDQKRCPADRTHRTEKSSTQASKWMTEEQDNRFASSVILGQSTTAEDKWRSIYRQIFDIPEDVPVPDPYYDYLVPSHQFDRIEQGVSTNNTAYNTSIYPYDEPVQENSLVIAPFNPPIGDASTRTTNASERLAYPTTNGSGAQGSGYDIRSQSLTSPTVFLTAQSLDINERGQPAPPYEYGIYQFQDSGYQSLGQLSGLETEVPLDISELVRSQENPSEAQPDEWKLSENDIDDPDSRANNAGLYLRDLSIL